MRFHGISQEVMGSKSQIEVLTTLLKYPGKMFSGREIARIAGVSKTRTAEILSNLEKNNLVNKKTIGNTNEWSLNPESVLVRYLSRHFLQMDGQMLDSLKNDLKTCLKDAEGISKVVLYGSVARGDETHFSDIDLLILLNGQDRRKVMRKVDELNLMVVAKYGNPVSVSIHTEKEYMKEGFAVELKDRINEEGIILMER